MHDTDWVLKYIRTGGLSYATDATFQINYEKATGRPRTSPRTTPAPDKGATS